MLRGPCAFGKDDYASFVPSSLSFRRATQADAALVVDLVQRGYRGDDSRAGWTTEADLLDGQRTDLEEVHGIIGDTQAAILLGFEAELLVACLAMAFRPAGAAYFGMIAVDPARQGEGYGRALLAEAERRALLEGNAVRARMTVIAQRSELIAWYGRRGYLATGERERFPYGNPRFGLPRRPDLYFEVLEKVL